jgi:hypothetical protein
LDQAGSFRGLAFANFRQSADADAVVAALNGFDVQGRKLRVEYKKVLQAGEKERIEREKAIRRMRSMQLEKEAQQQNNLNQLYEDYGSVINSAFNPPRTFSSGYQNQYSPPSMPTPQFGLGINSASAVPQPPTTPASDKATNELDMNDASTLEIYSRILVFKEDPMRDELAFSRTLSPKQRRVVHLVAQKLGVYHYSIGEGEERYAVVTRIDPQKVCSFNNFRWIDHFLTASTNLATICAKGSTYAFPHTLCLPYSFFASPFRGAVVASEKVDAGHEDSSFASAQTSSTCFQR